MLTFRIWAEINNIGKTDQIAADSVIFIPDCKPGGR